MKKSSHQHGHGCVDQSSQAKAVQNALVLMKEAGHKLTQPRQALLKAIGSFSGPFSTEEVFKATRRRQKNTKVDLVTVYRGLSTFAELGILSRIEFGDGVVRYELNDPAGHHHHFICQRCRKVEPLTLCEVENQESHLRKAGYSSLTHRLEFFGICPDCSRF